ncbi:signal peptidase [Parapedobacter sp. ISTM3]|uniref:Uncharacterized protein n=1 Tax=Parapedobacter luteus TaxID=623280 RepID=A0A1T5CX70_9SPHI|nr:MULTISPECIES: signal peptidase [Parapedobacter]MBK1440666.1 signal peptidase [Parapedobacter sp. ISTM3]SKB63800.1 hypothetical protein SAMN05660226_02422 [Parapedobacter luteus]
MNKYLRSGLLYTIAGLTFCALGYYLMGLEIRLYKWMMAIGVIIFGIGFLTVFYSFIRKIERQSILEERKERQNENE